MIPSRYIALLTLAFVATTPNIAEAETLVPKGFVRQTLEPLGGSIVRPTDWHYSLENQRPAITWICSKEDRADGTYDTGLKIQLLIDVEKVTGRTAREFVEFYLAEKQKAGQVHHVFPPVEDGLFIRSGIETTEGDYRIRYSLYYLTGGGDIVAFVTMGAKTSDWDEVLPTFEEMGNIRLLDPSHLKKDSPPGDTIVYMGFDPRDKRDVEIWNSYQEDYHLKNRLDHDDYSPARPIRGRIPRGVADENGQRIYGSALAAYMIDLDGRATNVKILTITDPRLEEAVRHACSTFRLKPAQIDGKPVRLIAAQEFDFRPDGE